MRKILLVFLAILCPLWATKIPDSTLEIPSRDGKARIKIGGHGAYIEHRDLSGPNDAWVISPDGEVEHTFNPSGANVLTAGDGIDISNNVVSVELDGSTLSAGSSGLKLSDGIPRYRGAYSTTGRYIVGDTVLHSGIIYLNKTAITANEVFTASKWFELSGSSSADIAGLRADLGNRNDPGASNGSAFARIASNSATFGAFSSSTSTLLTNLRDDLGTHSGTGTAFTQIAGNRANISQLDTEVMSHRTALNSEDMRLSNIITRIDRDVGSPTDEIAGEGYDPTASTTDAGSLFSRMRRDRADILANSAAVVNNSNSINDKVDSLVFNIVRDRSLNNLEALGRESTSLRSRNTGKAWDLLGWIEDTLGLPTDTRNSNGTLFARIAQNAHDIANLPSGGGGGSGPSNAVLAVDALPPTPDEGDVSYIRGRGVFEYTRPSLADALDTSKNADVLIRTTGAIIAATNDNIWTSPILSRSGGRLLRITFYRHAVSNGVIQSNRVEQSLTLSSSVTEFYGSLNSRVMIQVSPTIFWLATTARGTVRFHLFRISGNTISFGGKVFSFSPTDQNTSTMVHDPDRGKLYMRSIDNSKEYQFNVSTTSIDGFVTRTDKTQFVLPSNLSDYSFFGLDSAIRIKGNDLYIPYGDSSSFFLYTAKFNSDAGRFGDMALVTPSPFTPELFGISEGLRPEITSFFLDDAYVVMAGSLVGGVFTYHARTFNLALRYARGFFPKQLPDGNIPLPKVKDATSIQEVVARIRKDHGDGHLLLLDENQLGRDWDAQVTSGSDNDNRGWGSYGIDEYTPGTNLAKFSLEGNGDRRVNDGDFFLDYGGTLSGGSGDTAVVAGTGATRIGFMDLYLRGLGLGLVTGTRNPYGESRSYLGIGLKSDVGLDNATKRTAFINSLPETIVATDGEDTITFTRPANTATNFNPTDSGVTPSTTAEIIRPNPRGVPTRLNNDSVVLVLYRLPDSDAVKAVKIMQQSEGGGKRFKLQLTGAQNKLQMTYIPHLANKQLILSGSGQFFFREDAMLTDVTINASRFAEIQGFIRNVNTALVAQRWTRTLGTWSTLAGQLQVANRSVTLAEKTGGSYPWGSSQFIEIKVLLSDFDDNERRISDTILVDVSDRALRPGVEVEYPLGDDTGQNRGHNPIALEVTKIAASGGTPEYIRVRSGTIVNNNNFSTDSLMRGVWWRRFNL